MQRRHIITIFFSLSFLKQSVIGIVNGNKVADDKMQYMVSVQSMGSHVCGGFLVSENYVLTAAQCFDEHPDSVVLGSHNLKSKKMRINIEKKTKHPSYEEKNYRNDLMLLKLKKQAQVGSGVRIIHLPNENMRVEAGHWCEIAGWGATKVGCPDAKDLYGVRVSIMEQLACRSKWHNLPPNVICANGINNIRTFNQGDHGGPLVCNNIAVGIISFNREKEKEGPNVFVDISKYRQWINKETGLKGSVVHASSEDPQGFSGP